MKFLKPSYYDDFHCIGNKCRDNCCENWQISIDPKSMEKYQQVTGEFGQKLCDSISKEKSAFILKERKCPFLNKDRLCEIYTNLGEDYQCNTCKTYPRNIFLYGDLHEQSLMLSCPEVARILVSHKEPIKFYSGYIGNNDTKIENKIIDYDLYNLLTEARSLSVDIMQMRDFPLWKRQFWIFAYQIICTNKMDK